MDVLVNGIVVGLIYSLIAVGMSLILGVAKIFDLAYTSYYTVSAYIVVMLLPLLGNNCSLSTIFIFGVVASMLLAGAVHHFLIWPIRKQPTAVMVSTLAIAMVIQELLVFKEGSEPVFVPAVLNGTTSVMGVLVANEKLLGAVVAILINVLLWMFLTKTRLGLAIRAASEQPEAVHLSGADLRLCYLTAAVMAGCVAGIGGIVLSSSYPPSPYTWLDLLVIAFAVMVLGGLGNIRSCIPAGLILGISEVVVAIYVPYGGIIKRAVGLVIILLILVFRPTGLFGIQGWEEEA